MRIDVIFDTSCPWCFIGKRRFERALAERPFLKPDIRWRPFLLNPDIPTGGIDRDLYLERKFGSAHRVQRVLGAVAVAGEAEGIAFAFHRIQRTPNTVQSHRLIRFAEQEGRETEAVEAIFSSYFLHGRDIGEIGVLVEIGSALGLPARSLRTYLESDSDLSGIYGANARSHRLGVNGVPCFIFDERYAMAGAQEPELLIRLMDLAHEGQSADAAVMS